MSAKLLVADEGFLVTDDAAIFTTGSPIPDGWPCAALPIAPPSVDDRQSYPTADDLLPQVLALTPRGPAWGTDGLGDGGRASPVQRSFWRAIAAWAANNNVREFDLATQSLPSAISWSLPDWELEYGLPDACLAGPASIEARIAAVRVKFAALGGASPAYFICLAQSVGYTVTIEEPTQFMIDTSEVVSEGDGDQVSDMSMWKVWIVHVGALGSTWFRVDEAECDLDPLEGFLTAEDLECLLRRDAPTHTELVFSYDGAS